MATVFMIIYITSLLYNQYGTFGVMHDVAAHTAHQQFGKNAQAPAADNNYVELCGKMLQKN